MQSITTTAHVQVWGIAGNGALVVLGTISIDRTAAPWTYTAGTGDEQCDFHTEPAAAAWLARRCPEYCEHVFIGHVLRPDYDDWAVMQPDRLGRLLAGRH